MTAGLLVTVILGFLKAAEYMESVGAVIEFHERLSKLIDGLRGMFEDREASILEKLASLKAEELDKAREVFVRLRRGGGDEEDLARLWEAFYSVIEGTAQLAEGGREVRKDAARALGKLALASAILAACGEARVDVSADEVVSAVYELLEIPVAPLVAELAEARAGLPSLADLAAGRVYRWPVVDEVLERAARGESFVLVGPAASGKTYSLATASWELTTRGRLVFYVNAQVGRADLAEIDVGRVRRRLEDALGRRVGRELVRRMVFILDRAEAAPREVGEAFERVRRAGATAIVGTRRSLSHPWERESPFRGVKELRVGLSEKELVKFADWLCRVRGLSLSAKEVRNLVRGGGYNPLFIAELVRGGGTLRLGSLEEVRESLAEHVVWELQRVVGGGWRTGSGGSFCSWRPPCMCFRRPPTPSR